MRQKPGIRANTPDCQTCPLRQQPFFRPFDERELSFVSGLRQGGIRFPARRDIVLEGETADDFYTLHSGWAFRYQMLPEGRRQILNFLLPGDILGLQARLYGKSTHSVGALTEVRLCVFPKSRLFELYRDHPQLGYELTWATVNEGAIVDRHLTTVGRGSALRRVAYLLAETFARLERRGMVGDESCEVPLTQEHLADALGLSAVHVNRTLRLLSRMRIARLGGGRLIIDDWDRLVQISGFGPRGPVTPRALL